MKFFSRRDFLKTATAGVVGISLVGNGVKAQFSGEERGFYVDIPIIGPDSFVQDSADAYLTGAKNLGANSVTFDFRHRFENGSLRYLRGDDLAGRDFEVYSRTSESKGLTRYASVFVENDGLPPINSSSGFLDSVADKTIELARMADNLGVEMFSPHNEILSKLNDPARINSWLKELIPQVRQVYKGRLVPKVLTGELDALDLSGVDGLGLEAWPSGAKSPSQFGQRYSDLLRDANRVSRSYGYGDVVVAETGLPVGGDLAGAAGDPRVNSNFVANVTEGVQEDVVREILSRSNGITRGLYFFGVGSGATPWAVDGRPAGEVVRKAWGGSGPNSHPDKKPAVLKTVIDGGVYRAGPNDWFYPEINLALHMNDVSGPEDIEGFRIMGKGGGDPNSKLLVDGMTPFLRVQKWRVGDGGNVPFEIYPEGKVRISDKHGHRDERIVIPKDRMPKVAPKYRGNVNADLVTVPIGGKLEYRLPTRDQDGTPLSWEHAFIRLLDNNWQPLKKITMELNDTSLSLSKLIPNARKGMTYNVQVVVGGGKPNESLMPDGSTFVKWIREVGAGARLKVV